MLRYIYTFFVGVFLAIFIGMGIEVFYPGPTPPEYPTFYSGGKELTVDEQKQQQDFDIKQKAYDKQLQHHNRYVSIIVLSCAVVVLAIALTFADKLGVIADGILLGGIFTLLYGIIRGMATDSNKYRFLVATIGLVITLVLGYFKFAKHEAKLTARK